MMIGQTILHYKILAKIGEGGMGVVYKARDTRLDRDVAIKFLPGQVARNSEARERFEVEARAAGALNHPNITTIYAIEDADDQLFIVMEYVEGEELGAIIRQAFSAESDKANHLPIETTRDYIMQIAAGLQAAHDKGIIHRDIKSSNIMVTGDGQIKIMDFGLAKLAGSDVKLTKEHTTLGTAAYMSPEQLRGESLDHRSDIWSFGVVMYEMLTGKMPFTGEYEQAVTYAILNEPCEPIKSDGGPQRKLLADLVHDALAKSPEARPESAGSILHLLADPGIRAMPNQSRTGVPLRSVAVVGGFVAAILLIWFGLRPNADSIPDTLLSEIDTQIEEENYLQAMILARQFEPDPPGDIRIAARLPRMAIQTVVTTEPPGAKVELINHRDNQATSYSLARIAADSIWVPRGRHIWRTSSPGYPAKTIVKTAVAGTMHFFLDDPEVVPSEMVYVPEGRTSLPLFGFFASGSGTHSVPAFLLDRHEVSNKQYKEFVDAGGYTSAEYWPKQLVSNNERLSFAQATSRFVDATGIAGPSTWELGSWPEGKADHPVSGISWYEAAAYAKFAGKALPTVYQWARAASLSSGALTLKQSNFSGSGPQKTGARLTPGYYGNFDMAGNVREWCWNTAGSDRFALGGAYSEPVYMFSFAGFKDPFDRSPINGVRCARPASLDAEPAVSQYANLQVKRPRDLKFAKPVDDETFEIFKRFYTYDAIDPAPQFVNVDSMSSEHWIREVISINSGYNNERMEINIFLPRAGKLPFQTIVLFPGAGALTRSSSRDVQNLNSLSAVDFLPQAGRAFVYPIWKGMYERQDGFRVSTWTANAIRDHMVMWRKELGQTLDYLETRAEIDMSRLGYYGSSLGAQFGPVVSAVEPRIKLDIYRLAGLYSVDLKPEADPLNFMSRVSVPTLVLNGRYDHLIPYENSQVPFFNLLGTSEEDKRLVLFDVAHQSPSPRHKAIRETLAWLDKYFGPVNR